MKHIHQNLERVGPGARSKALFNYEEGRGVTTAAGGRPSTLYLRPTSDLDGCSNYAEACVVAIRLYSEDAEGPVFTGAEGTSLCSTAMLEKLHAEIVKDGFNLVWCAFTPPEIKDQAWGHLFDLSLWVGPNGVISFCGTTSFTGLPTANSIFIDSTDRNLVSKYLDLWRSFLPKDDARLLSHARVQGIFASRNGPCISSFNRPIGWPFEPINYEPNIVTFYKTVIDRLAEPAPMGRLVLMDGEPGTGKTFLLRGMVHDLADKADFIYLPASMIPELDGPQLLSLLNEDDYPHSGREKSKPKILLVEDADECLIPRGTDNMSSVRNLLNYCDGFLGAILDIRIVATTNTGYVGRTGKADEALLRPGRLLAKETLRKLSPEVASACLRSLIGKSDSVITDSISLARVYSIAREHGWKPSDLGTF